MGLISGMLFTKEFFSDNIEEFKDQFRVKKNSNEEYRSKGNLTVKAFLMILFIVILNVLPAMIIALHCASKDTGITKYLHPLIALLFSDVYLLVFVIRKFLLNDSSFCTSILVKN